MLRAKSKGVRFSHLLLIGLVVHGAAGLAQSQSVSKPRTIVIHYGTLKLREREVFEFLDQHVSSAKGTRRSSLRG